MKYMINPSLILSALLMCAAPALGAEADAKQLFLKGERHFAAGEFAEALTLYQQAYQLRPLPGFHFNIGQCHRSLGQFEEAIAQFRLYLKKSDPPKHRADAEALIRSCEEELQRIQEAERQAQQSSPQPGAAVVDPSARVDGVEPRSGDRRGLRPHFFWAGVGLTGALALTATITGALALGKSSSYNDPSTPRGDLQGLKDSGESLSTASTVTFVLTLAAAAGTAVTYFYTDFGPRKGLVSAGPLAGGGAVFLRGQF